MANQPRAVLKVTSVEGSFSWGGMARFLVCAGFDTRGQLTLYYTKSPVLSSGGKEPPAGGIADDARPTEKEPFG